MSTPTPSSTRAGRTGAPIAALVAILLLVGALAWAAHPAPVRPAPVDSTRTERIARDFSCAGGLPGAQATVGLAGSGASGLTVDGSAPAHPTLPLTGTPATVSAPAAVAARAYAVRAAQGHGKNAWYAGGACPSPRSSWWFVGAGGSQSHRTVLTLADPRHGDAIVNVSVLGPDGPVKAPGLSGLRVRGGGRITLDLSKVAPAVGDLAVHVAATRGLVTASAADSWSPDFVANPALDWLTDQPHAARSLTLAGLPSHGGRTSLLIANPSAVDAVVRLSLIGAHGRYAPTSGAVVRVPPGAVHAVALGSALAASPAAIRLSSQVRIAASARVLRGADDAYLPTVAPLAGVSVTGIPAHPGSARLVLIGSARAGAVRVEWFDRAGGSLGATTVTTRRDAASSLSVPAKATALTVRGAATLGALVMGEGTTSSVAVLALDATTSEAHVPVVRPRW